MFTLFLKEDSDPFLVYLSSNGVLDFFVFRLLLFGSVECLMAYGKGHQVRSWSAGVPAEFSSNPN